MKPYPPLLLFFVLFSTISGISQSSPRFPDGRMSGNCMACRTLFAGRPKEILFGITINANGEVLFSVTNREWFEKLMSDDGDAISVDLVTKDQYGCGMPPPGINGFAKGVFLDPVYRPALKNKMVDAGNGHIYISIGKVPPALKGKELEGNLAILHGGQVCMYTYFTDIPRILWDLLPMGLYADTLVNYQTPNWDDTTVQAPFFYTKELAFTVPFQKGKAQFNKADLQPLYDSLKLADYNIQRIDIRSYSSVEGSVEANTLLQQQRAESMVKALQQFQHAGIDTHISYSENWVEFKRDIAGTGFNDLGGLSEEEIRTKLTDKDLLSKIEPVLKNHRKAIVTIWLTAKSQYEQLRNADLVSRFNTAVAKKDTSTAIVLQRTLFEQVAAGKAPDTYLDQLEIPREQTFDALLNNREVYNLLLNRNDAEVTIQNLQNILKLSPGNGKIKYNISALSLQLWKTDSSFVRPAAILQDINGLGSMGIPPSLVKRMLINYHIVMSEIDMARFDYGSKDVSLTYIKDNYQDLHLEDKDLLALAKYLCYYQQCNWSESLLSSRITKIDVNEDLLFYYVNLQLAHHINDIDSFTRQVIDNAISINPRRFCRYFNAIGNGGITFQLLDNPVLKDLYCSSCKEKKQ